jgi:hypothetical protein
VPKESSETKVVATRLTPGEVKDLQAIGGQLSKQAAGVSVAVAEVIAIMVRRDLPRFKEELGLAKPTKPAKSTAA